ncbi:MAG TPA: hypothetical protein VGW34_12705 [Allosphingosinicella sp.]|nr:hypothetical protein [Allosphingosinicella sp.]
MRLDECGEMLRPLFCDNILDLNDHMEKFRDLMMELDYSFEGAGARSINSALMVIRGALGSGKTTLGAWMIAEMIRLQGDDPWAVFHVRELPFDTDESRTSAFTQLQDQIAAVPKGKHVAVLVDNITAASLNAAIACYEKLRAWPKLFVLTTHNLKLLDADERTMGGSVPIEVFTLREMTAADADAYVAHRLPQYRDPERAEIEALSPIFPFEPGQPGRVVQRGEDQGASPVVLRQLNTHFRKRLAAHARHVRELQLPAVEQVPADTLPQYLMSDQ